jgi:hypothetical protein
MDGMRRLPWLAVLGVVTLVARASAAEIRALGGTWDEQVTSITEEAGRLVVRTPQRAVPLEQVKSIRFQDESATRSERRLVKVLLTTGDCVRGALQPPPQGEQSSQPPLRIESQGLGVVTVPLDLVRAILVDCTPERERELEGSLDAHDELDHVRLKDRGIATGSVTLVNDTRVVIDTTVKGGSNTEVLTIDIAKVEVVEIAALEGPPAAVTGLRVQARLIDGSTVTGRFKGLEGAEARMEHPLGGRGDLVLQLARISELVVQNGAFVYVSDLQPQAVVQHFPPEYTYEPEVWGWKRDHNVTGGALRLGGRTFDKGIGVHSYCSLTFPLGGSYKEFKAVIGLDDATRYLGEPGFGSVVFKVLVDGKPAREAAGWTKRKGDPGTELSIDVSGAQSITLIADFDSTTLHILGRGDWADAHLIKR